MRDLRPEAVAWFSLTGFCAVALSVGLALEACNVTQKKVVHPTTSDYKAALEQINENLSTNVLPALVVLRNEDLAAKPPRHTAEWWTAKLGLVSDSASLASSVAAR